MHLLNQLSGCSITHTFKCSFSSSPIEHVMHLFVLKFTTELVRLYLQDCLQELWASLVAPVVKKLSANAGDSRDSGLIPSLEDPLEKEMATHSVTLAWEISWTEEPGGLQSVGSQRVGHD